MQVIIDRFEGNFAVVELDDKTTVDMPKCLLPDYALEGDIINIEINRGETAKRIANIKKLEQSLWED